jgi:hypothetical protein
MRILLLADLHFREPWFRWLAAQKADLSVIAGDLLDGFRAGGLLPQMGWVSGWCARFPGYLAVSSGNHDGNEPGGSFDPDGLADMPEEKREMLLPLLQAKYWMDFLERPGLVTDGRSSLVPTPSGAVVVTTIPFNHRMRGNEVADELWQEGQRLRICSRAPWIVLHHEPPADTAVGGQMGDSELFYRIREFRPNYVASGHLHGQPYTGSFADKIYGTWSFNPGFPVLTRAMKSKIPNHIVLDLAARTATWHATPNVGQSPIIKQIRLT